ncbi:hypothetical protein GBAR_LOCUS6076 [Geodia barretti]|uniref:Uncharacterized protein n=1 Tax=Geodia barretti TaxID=519541 RepID=A0AA35W6A6_GEOBA|nr:hypothetical protein GBAR_LOCUS6076 [Geodia barretti]
MLFYFPDILPQLVFMEPQMLRDKARSWCETYHMRQGKKGVPREKLRFRDHGASDGKVSGASSESHYEPPLFTPKSW